MLTLAGTAYSVLGGCHSIAQDTTEAVIQTQVRATLTVGNLYVLAPANTRNGATTVTSRKNAANGNLTVSISAGATGAFLDTTHTDSVVSGDQYDTAVTLAGSSGSITIANTAVTLQGATNTTTYPSCAYGTNLGPGTIVFGGISGDISQTASTEGHSQWKAEYSSTLSNLQMTMRSNDVGASTVTLRKNGAFGNETLSIGAGATGQFIDTTNTDSFVATDLLDIEISTGAGGTAFKPGLIAIQNQNTNKLFSLISNNSNGFAQSSGQTNYTGLVNNLSGNATESQVQLEVEGGTYTAANLFVNISANTLNGTTTVQFRKNGANGTLVVSVPSSTGGNFEDTTDTDSVTTADLVNASRVTAGSSGQITQVVMGFQFTFVPPAPVVKGVITYMA